ncbi:MAG: N-methylhydantoinase [Thermoleophilaceae bacterium]|jgi:N-methylhydantoinase A|nr:N-methylhydantoinase [Thermoleophilaceae bacterium]
MIGPRAGIDVGGTFTDAVLVGANGQLHVAKVRSTPQDASSGFLDGLAELARRAGVDTRELGYLAHGTTVATNAVVQGRLARAGLITTAGFRDVLEIGTQQRRHVYDLWTPQPAAVIPRERCHGVRGRIGPDGAEVEPLAGEDVVAAARALAADGVEAVAVALLFSFLNPAHELRVVEILAAELPDVPVTRSSHFAPEVREYVRASTTALNAALLPPAGTYVRRLAERLRGDGVTTPLHLMQSNGGVTTAASAAELPVGLVASGPAAGVIGAARLGAVVGQPDLLTLDMGGTTADIAVVLDGLSQLRFQGDHGGHPVNLPQIDVLSVGAGGGSIAAVDRFGSLTVGPESAGADPGPAAYGSGGEDATLTDAHLVLGTLDPGRALGGSVRLDPDAARAAIRRAVAAPLGLSDEAAAEAIVRIADANMADALRVVSVARGHDPRRFALVGLGGAGPMHACAIAAELGVPRVVVPRHPGVTAALGLLLSDVRHDLRRSWFNATADVDINALDAAVGALEDEGRERLRDAGHVDGEVAFELDMRYRGQAYNLTVPLAARPVTAATVAAAEAAFEEAHRQAYDYTPSVTETEIVTVRARATGAVSATTWETPAAPAPRGAAVTRDVWRDDAWRAFTVVERAALAQGDAVAERTIVEQEDATVVVPAGWSGTVAAAEILVLTKGAA